VYPLSNYGFGAQCEKGLIIGYAYSATDQIVIYGKQLADLIKQTLKPA